MKNEEIDPIWVNPQLNKLVEGQDLLFYANKKGLISAILVLSTLILLIFYVLKVLHQLQQVSQLTYSIDWMLLIIYPLTTLLYYVYLLIRNPPILIIDSKGVHNTAGINIRFVPWNNMLEAKVVQLRLNPGNVYNPRKKFLMFIIKNPKNLKFTQRWLCFLNNIASGESSFGVPQRLLSIPAEEALLKIKNSPYAAFFKSGNSLNRI